MNRKHCTGWFSTVRLAILALVLVLALFIPACKFIWPEPAVVQWISNFTGMEIDTPTGSTHVALDVDQVGSGDIVDFKDGGSTVWQIADGGALTHTGAFDVDTTGAISLDADTASNFNVAGAGIDLTIESEAGRLILKGDEAAANAIHIDANDVVTTGLDIDVGSASGLTIDGGLTNIGGATGAGTADGDKDLIVDGDLEVDETLDVDGDIDLDGTGLDADVSSAISLDAGATSNFNTSAGDVKLEAETGSVWIKGDEEVADAIHLDANQTVTVGIDIDVGSVYGLTIDGGLANFGGATGAGTATGDGDVIVDGHLEVDETLDVDGGFDLDGTVFDVALTGAGFSIDGTAASNVTVSDASADLTILSDAGSLILKGDEAVATAVQITANDVVTTGITIVVGSVSGLSIDGGLTDFGTGTYATANGDNDVGIEGDLEVNTDCDFDGNVDIDGTTNLDAVDIDGAIDIAGQTITWDTDSDTTSVASQDDVITYTIGGASGYLVITTGNFVVGTPGTASLALNGNDGYFEGTLEADGLARLDGGATLGAGDLTISNGSFFPDFTDAVVSDGDTITPTAYCRSLSASGNVTITLGASCTDGQPLVIIADDAHDYIINATNLRTTDGAALTLNQYDTAGFICRANEWWLLYESNNQ